MLINGSIINVINIDHSQVEQANRVDVSYTLVENTIFQIGSSFGWRSIAITNILTRMGCQHTSVCTSLLHHFFVVVDGAPLQTSRGGLVGYDAALTQLRSGVRFPPTVFFLRVRDNLFLAGLGIIPSHAFVDRSRSFRFTSRIMISSIFSTTYWVRTALEQMFTIW